MPWAKRRRRELDAVERPATTRAFTSPSAGWRYIKLGGSVYISMARRTTRHDGKADDAPQKLGVGCGLWPDSMS